MPDGPPPSAQSLRRVAEAAWRWVLDQVRWQDGPWIPFSTNDSLDGPNSDEAGWDRDGLHSGVGGLACVLAEIRLHRGWTTQEQELADAVVQRLRLVTPAQTDCTFFDGLASSIGTLSALDAPGTDAVVARLAHLAEADGWPQTTITGPRYTPQARVSDLTLGTAGVLLGALWARRTGVPEARAVADHAATVLLAEAEQEATGTNWLMVPRRFRTDDGGVQMPNLSHGVAGIATALALAGADLDRPELVKAARSGAEHLVSLGDAGADGFVVPRYLPPDHNDQDEITYTWCHGGTGTSLLFLALATAGVTDVAGRTPLSWHRRCLHSVRRSGVPARLHPGFWDNDGRCCGTAGVGDVFLDSWHRAGDDDDLDFAVQLAGTLVRRVVWEGPSHAYWRFTEHRSPQPRLPPGVGWMQGAVGIAAFLFHAARVLDDGPAARATRRLDNWWALPPVRDVPQDPAQP